MINLEGHPGMGPGHHTPDPDPDIQAYEQVSRGIIHLMSKSRTIIPTLLGFLPGIPPNNSSRGTRHMRYIYTNQT